MTKQIGFSTGVLYKKYDSISERAIRACSEIGCNTIELNCHEWPLHIFKMQNRTVREAVLEDDFESVSLHMPCNMSYSKHSPITMNSVIYYMRMFQRLFDLHHIVVHPNQIDTPSLFRSDFINFAIENMDHRKDCCRRYWEVVHYLTENQQFKLIFDINHHIDTGGDAEDIPILLEKYKPHLVGIHISGIDDSRYHVPLYRTKQNEFIEPLKDISDDIPIIIESVCANEQEMAREFEYVCKYAT